MRFASNAPGKPREADQVVHRDQAVAVHQDGGDLITVQLDQPTRDGDTELHLLCNVPPAKADAVKLVEVYRKRWTMEVLFLELTETLS